MITTENNTLPEVDLKFILVHKVSKEEIVLPVLWLCEEYSSIAFRAADVDDEYHGIGKLPSYPGDDTVKDYDVYVEINNVRHIYSGVYCNAGRGPEGKKQL